MLQNPKLFQHQEGIQRKYLLEAFQISDFSIRDAEQVSIMQTFQNLKKKKKIRPETLLASSILIKGYSAGM